MKRLLLAILFLAAGAAHAGGLLQGDELQKEVSARCAKGCVVMTEADIGQMREQLAEIAERAEDRADEEAKRANAWMCTTRAETNPDVWGRWAK